MFTNGFVRMGGVWLRFGLLGALAICAALVTTRSSPPAEALFHFAVIDEVMFGRGADPNVQYVEIRMLTSGQNIVANTRLSAWNADGSFFGVILLVPSSPTVPNSASNARWIMGTPAFAASAGITPEFLFNPVNLPSAGMICWGAPGVIPPDPLTWDATNPANYVDCVPYGGYVGAPPGNIRFGPATPFGLGDGTNSLTRQSHTDNTSVDFVLTCPAPQANTNAIGFNHDNHIDLPPTKAFDDLTWPNSDLIGDECGDLDDDNDGLSDIDELGLPGPACPPATAPTNPLRSDSDGDLFLDGAECALGTDPNDPNSFPLITACGNTTDADGDGILHRIEFCHYNTDPNNANTDGDACSDGKEVASINGDANVNAIDLSQLAQHFSANMADPLYLAAFDVNKSRSINSIDLSFVAQRFGPC